ncbi:hypothetical protein ACFCYC_30335 [Streptomyces sp. NPDC056402]|uniref:hypothetical protein n=1 Tax=Streptomyces sp. NPDC056402 TaxID=3345810 RepID=UPI0035D945D6
MLLLGRVVIEGAAGRIDSNRQSAAVELVEYLALNLGADHHVIDDALWPGRLVNKQMRNAVIGRTRSWLGKNADGESARTAPGATPTRPRSPPYRRAAPRRLPCGGRPPRFRPGTEPSPREMASSVRR